jgi:hypothetical protein
MPTPQATAATSTAAGTVGRNRTMRVTISLPAPVYQFLQRRSDLDGRSLSNLCSVLLEIATRQLG